MKIRAARSPWPKPRIVAQVDDDDVAALRALTTEMRNTLAGVNKRMKAVEKVVAGVDDIGDFDTIDAKQLQRMMNGGARGQRRAGRDPVGDVDPNDRKTELKALADFARQGPDRVMKNTLREDIGPDGGYTATPALSSTMTKRLFDQSPFRRLARVETITTAEFEEILDEDDVNVGEWVGEMSDRPETGGAQLGKITIPADEIYALQPITQNLLDDSNYDLGGWIETKVADKFGRTEGAAHVYGNGVKKPMGYMSLAVDTAADGVRAKRTLQYVASGSGIAVTADALRNLYWSMRAAHRANATWLMASSTANAIDKLKSGQGDYLWRDAMIAGAQPSLLGRPVEFDENMPAIAGDAFPIAFGDWKAGYCIVDRVGIRWLRDPYTTKGVVKFYGYRRTGGSPMNCDAIKLMKIST